VKHERFFRVFFDMGSGGRRPEERSYTHDLVVLSRLLVFRDQFFGPCLLYCVSTVYAVLNNLSKTFFLFNVFANLKNVS
jgi:hypothetical protein